MDAGPRGRRAWARRADRLWGTEGKGPARSATVPLPFGGLSEASLAEAIRAAELVVRAASAKQWAGRRAAGRGRADVDVPAVTLGVVALMTPAMLLKADFCRWALSPHAVLRGRQVRRLVSSHFIHTSWEHFLPTVAGTIAVGSALEERRGARVFAADVAVCGTLSSVLATGAMAVCHRLGVLSDETYFIDATCGATSLVYALEAVRGAEMSGTTTVVGLFGVPLYAVPSEFAPWASLILQEAVRGLLAPATWATAGGGVGLAFVSHAAGIAAGLLRVHARPTAVWLLARVAGLADGRGWAGRGTARRLNDRGAPPPRRGGGQRARRRGPLVPPRWLAHAACLGGAILVHVWATKARTSPSRLRIRV